MCRKDFNEQQKEFLRICEKNPVDYGALTRLLHEGVDINADTEYDFDGKSMLSNIISEHGYESHCRKPDECTHITCTGTGCENYVTTELSDGESLHRLTQFFLDNGFDARNYGEECMSQLCWSTCDGWVLKTAELLLDAGASVTRDYVDGANHILASIEWKLGEWNTGAYASANLMFAYHEMAKRAAEGMEYRGIRNFDECVGRKIRKIEKLHYEAVPETADGHPGEYQSLIIWCDELPLYVYKHPALYVNPYARGEAVSVTDITGSFSELVGLEIRELQFVDNSTAILSFADNELVLLFHCIQGKASEAAYLSLRILNQELRQR